MTIMLTLANLNILRRKSSHSKKNKRKTTRLTAVSVWKMLFMMEIVPRFALPVELFTAIHVLKIPRLKQAVLFAELMDLK